MKKFIVMLTVVCMTGLIGCSTKYEENNDKWDCSVVAAEDNTAETYVITYSEEKIVPEVEELSFQNRNDFVIAVHLISDEGEKKIEIPAGGTVIQKDINVEKSYTVGVHADVTEGTEINLMVYEGERSEVY